MLSRSASLPVSSRKGKRVKNVEEKATTAISSPQAGSRVGLLSVVSSSSSGGEKKSSLSVLGSFGFDSDVPVKGETAAAKRIGMADFSFLTSQELARSYARFLANGASPEDDDDDDDSSESHDVDATAAVTESLPAIFLTEDEDQFSLEAASVAFAARGEKAVEDDDENDDSSDLKDELTAAEEAVVGENLEVVEAALVKQLSSRSEDFFRALSNLNDLSREVSATCAQVRRLRGRVQTMQCDAVQGVLRVPRLACRQTNLIALHSKLLKARDVKKACDEVHAAMLNEDYSSTIGLILDARGTMASLYEVKSLKHIAKRLDQFYELAVSYMGSRFVNLAVATSWDKKTASGDDDAAEEDDDDDLAILDEAIDEGSPGSKHQRKNGGSSSSSSSSSVVRPQPRSIATSTVAPLIEGLARAGRLKGQLGNFQHRFDEEARDVVGTVVGEYAADEAKAEGGKALDGKAALQDAATAQLLSLSPPTFQRCFETCLEHLLTQLLCAVALHNLVYDYFATAALSGGGLLVRGESQKSRGGGAGDGDSDNDDGTQKQQQQQQHHSEEHHLSQFVDEEDDHEGHDLESRVLKAARRRAPAIIRNRPAKMKRRPLEDPRLKAVVQHPATPIKGNPLAGGPLSPIVLLDLASKSGDVTLSLCDSVVKKAARLVSLREEPTSKAKLRDVLRLWEASRDFGRTVQKVGGDAEPLKRAAVRAARAYLDRQHARHKNDLVAALDSEKWVQCDVAPERQNALDRLATGRSSSAATSAQNGGGGPPGAPQEKNNDDEAPREQTTTKKNRDLRSAVIDGKAHKVVWSAVVLVDMIADKLSAAATLPIVAGDVANFVVDLLRFFESRTRYLVLSAGALNSSARLRTITARHLGLASQCLSLVVTLAPHLRATLAAHVKGDKDDEAHSPRRADDDSGSASNNASPLADLDDVKRDYLDHHNRILSKFVSIIGESLEASSRSLSTTNWDEPIKPNSGEKPQRKDRSAFAQDVVRNVEAMHSVLAKLLPPEQLQEVFTNIFDTIASKIPLFFDAVNPELPHGRKKVADDLRFIVVQITKLQTVPSSNLRRLDSFITDKYAQQQRAPTNGGH